MNKMFSRYLSMWLVTALVVQLLWPAGTADAAGTAAGTNVSGNSIFVYLCEVGKNVDPTPLYWTVSQNSISVNDVRSLMESKTQYKNIDFKSWEYKSGETEEMKSFSESSVSVNGIKYICVGWMNSSNHTDPSESTDPSEHTEPSESTDPKLSQATVFVYLNKEKMDENENYFLTTGSISKNSLSDNDVQSMLKEVQDYQKLVQNAQPTWKYLRGDAEVSKQDDGTISVSPNDIIKVYAEWTTSTDQNPVNPGNTENDQDKEQGKDGSKEDSAKTDQSQTDQTQTDQTQTPSVTQPDEKTPDTQAGTSSESKADAEEKKYTVKLDLNGGEVKKGSSSKTTLTMKEGTAVLGKLPKLKETSTRKLLGWADPKGRMLTKEVKLDQDLSLTAVWAEVSYKNETAVTIQIKGPKASTKYKISYKNETKKDKKSIAAGSVKQGKSKQVKKLVKGDAYVFTVTYTFSNSKKETAELKYVNKPQKLKGFEIDDINKEKVVISLKGMSKKIDGWELQEKKKKKWSTVARFTEAFKYLDIDRKTAVKGTKYRARTYYFNSKGKRVFGEYCDEVTVNK